MSYQDNYTSNVTHVIDYGQYNPYVGQLNSGLNGGYGAQTITFAEGNKMADGTKPVVICAGRVEECKDLDAAQAKAEALAHQHSADAYILKPIKKVAPKRDVVTTDLP